MKIELAPPTIDALKKIQDKIKNKNEYAQKRFAPLVNQIVMSALEVFSDSHIDDLAGKLISPKAKKKALARSYEKLIEEYGENAYLKFERSVKRNKTST